MASKTINEAHREETAEQMDELLVIQQTLNAPKGQYNSFGKYRYRSCEDILAAVKPLLKETGCTLTLSDDIVMCGDRIYVKAIATLATGSGRQYTTTAFAREDKDKKGMDGSQITGAASSYARKYALNGLFAIDDTKDADATNTQGNDTSSNGKGGQKDGDIVKTAIAEIMATRNYDEFTSVWNRWACEYPQVTINGGEFWNAANAKVQQFKK